MIRSVGETIDIFPELENKIVNNSDIGIYDIVDALITKVLELEKNCIQIKDPDKVTQNDATFIYSKNLTRSHRVMKIIPVEDQLPEEEQEVLCFFGHSLTCQRMIGCRVGDNWFIEGADIKNPKECVIGDVTHFSYFPKEIKC